jgi:predicted short-subunit dehydrogenase-like oxidoreductase (DUF2520 family)
VPGFVIVGPGRAGRSFLSALQGAGWRCDGLVARGDDPVDVAATTDVVLLTVPDDAIAATAAAIAPGPAVVLHASGARGLDVLARHRRRGSVHPLMSLPDPTTGARHLTTDGVFAVAGDPMAAELVAALGGRAIAVADDRRAGYHAAATVAANHLVVLCAQVERLAGGAGVPLDAYWSLMASTLDNVRRSGPVSSLTGPAARGDSSTIARHLDAIPDHEHPLYLTLAREAARLAGASPGLDRGDRSPARDDSNRGGTKGNHDQ